MTDSIIEKITNTDPESKSLDLEAQNIEQLKQLFPDVFREGKVDFEALKAVLGAHVEDKEDHYNFSWHGKSRARQIAQTPSTGTLRPCKEESANWDATQNLFIEGDNLEVLKLLQKSYHQKVKMIYIDPPYNTGNDFVYKDNFHNNVKNYMDMTGQLDEKGINKSANADSSGRYHTDWLNMIYPRLKLARNLLKDDGVIFVSIDDNELINLRKVCDEIFGEDNFVATFIWEKRTNRENRKVVSTRHDYIVCYTKSKNEKERALKQLPMNEKALANYKNPDNDQRGDWKSDPAHAQAGHGTKSQFYDLIAPNGNVHKLESGRCWLYTQPVMDIAIKDNRIWFGKEGNGVPRIKTYLHSKERGLTPETILFAKDVTTNEIAKNQLKTLFDGKAIFDTPKPTELLKVLAQLATKDELVLDFFCGSASMAQAIMELNAEDGGKRKFILVQLPEACDEKSEAKKFGFNTISEISIERIKRAGKLVESVAPNFKGDTGFKVLKLDETNVIQWEPDFDNLSDILDDSIDSLKPERTNEDVLYEILLKYGLSLTYPITEHTLAGKTVYDVAFGSLIVCLDDGITRETVEEIGKLKQELDSETTRVVFKDAGFADDAVKVNAIQLLKQYGVNDVKSI
ncbi:MAG: site-specific DNA-methyltransferase [Colwellia polaris]